MQRSWLSLGGLCLVLSGCAAAVDEPLREVGSTREELAMFGTRTYQLLDSSGRALRKPTSGSTPTMVFPGTSGIAERGFTLQWVWGWDPTTANSGDELRVLDSGGLALRHATTTPSLGSAEAQSHW